MALQGTIDDFPLTDVLSLLAASSRSGRLLLDGDRGPATLVIDQGQVVGGGPAGPGAAARELVFEMLRHRQGAFGFEAVDAMVDPEREVGVEPCAMASCIEDAGRMLDRWREIESVVPSPRCRARLVPELTVASVELDADDWRVVAAIGDGRSIEQLRGHLALDELPLCERVADLVGSGVLTIESPDLADESADDLDRHVAPDPGADQPGTDEPTALDPAAIEQASAGAAPWAAADQDPSDDPNDWVDRPRDDSPVGWLVAEDDQVPEDGPAAEDLTDPATPGVPERFPIDDLLGEPGGADDDPWASPEMERLQQQRAEPVEERIEFEPVPLDVASPGAELASEPVDEPGDSADEVLRQMSKLSPEAAEAIAAALSSPPSSSTLVDDDPDDDGPVTYLGTL